MVDNPSIEDWGLYFLQKHGYDNRSVVMKAFAEFWSSAKLETLEVPGDCILGGKVFGHERILDGDDFYTSAIRTITRINFGDYCGVPHDLMHATSITGRNYYFYSDDHNVHMRLMLGDLIQSGELSHIRGFYLDPKDRGKGFI